MAWKEIRRHPLDYAVLAIVAILAMSIYLHPDASLASKDITSFLLGFFYAGWGIWHHRRRSTLSVNIALEYVVMGALVSLVLWLTMGY